MKDIKSSLGGTTYPADGNPGTLKAIVVRSKGAYGRRIGILANNDTVIAGSKLHAADFQHTPDPVAELPTGYTHGLVVELSPQRNYQTAFTFQNTAAFAATEDNPYSEMSSAIKSGLAAATGYDPVSAERIYPTGMANTPRETVGRNHISFTIQIAGQTYNLGLDFTKHPAALTADLNRALVNIHPNLRGYVAMQEALVPGGRNNWEIKLAAPAGVPVTLPVTDYIVETLTNPALVLANYGSFTPMHLNNALTEAVTITATDRTTAAMTPLPDPNLVAAKSVAQLVADRIIPGQETNNSLENWLNIFDIPAEKFAPYAIDPRYRIALIELAPEYYRGDLNRLEWVKYNLAGVPVLADLMVVPRGSFVNDAQYGNAYGTRLIDIEASLAAGKLVGVPELVTLNSDIEQTIPERGGLNYRLSDGDIYGSRLAIAVIAPPNSYNSFSPLFRNAVSSTSVEVAMIRDAIANPDFVFEETIFNWDKSSSNKATLSFKVAKFTGGEIVDATAYCRDLNIFDSNPIVTDQGTHWGIQFNDGFSGRELTFGYQAGTINYAVNFLRRPANNSAATRLMFQDTLDYTVVTPNVMSEITLETIPRFIIDTENNDLVEFTGTVQKPAGASASLMQPTYYAVDSEIETFINGSPVVGTVVKPIAEVDAVGNYKVIFTKSFLSNLGVGVHTLRVELGLNLYWSEGVLLNNVAEVQFEVLPVIEGTESELVISLPRNVKGFDIVDLDTDEVLVTSTSLENFVNNSETQGGVDVLLYTRDLEIPNGPL